MPKADNDNRSPATLTAAGLAPFAERLDKSKTERLAEAFTKLGKALRRAKLPLNLLPPSFPK